MGTAHRPVGEARLVKASGEVKCEACLTFPPSDRSGTEALLTGVIDTGCAGLARAM